MTDLEDEKEDLVLGNPKFNLKSYIADYSGKTKTDRLLFIAQKCPSLAQEALTLALVETKKKGKDSMLDIRHYNDIYHAAEKVLKDAPKPDTNHTKQVEESSTTKKVKLEDEIQKWRNLSSRDNTRIAYMNAAAYLSKLGVFDQALQKLAEARDFCSTQKDLNEVHMGIMKASIRQGSMSLVVQEAERLLSSNLLNPDSVHRTPEATLCQARAMSGLYHLKNKSYSHAVSQFLQAVRIGNFSDVMTKRDVGIYGTLCAMAAHSRSQLKSQLLENPSFTRCLDKAPLILKAARAMASAKYRLLMDTLRSVMSDIQLDIYLGPVLKDLLTAIRAAALVQYFQPFSSMDLHRMAKDFGFTVPEIEEELYQAILKKRIKARIDLADHVLHEYNEQTDRNSVMESLVVEGEEFCRGVLKIMSNLQLQQMKLRISKKQHMDADFGDEPEGGGGKYGFRWGNRKGARRRGAGARG